MRTRYNIIEGGTSFGIDLADAPQIINRMTHTSINEEVCAVEEFNRGVKRGETILVTGDRPRFALMKTFKEDKVDPDFIKLGDYRFGIKYGDDFVWIDTSAAIKTTFNPSSTEYEIIPDAMPDFEIYLTFSQLSDYGAIAKMVIKNKTNIPLNLESKAVYGGISKHGRTRTASYFDLTKDRKSGNSVEINDDCAIFGDIELDEKIYTYCIPSIKPVIDGFNAVFNNQIDLPANGSDISYFFVGRIGTDDEKEEFLLLDDPENRISDAALYYKNILSAYSISTPSKVLDSAFLTAILNLEYDYTGLFWLEGVHWWATVFPMNFQISASIALGGYERAKKALDFLGSLESGPCPLIYSTGNVSPDFGIEDGLPYYLYQLIHYYRSTGDKGLMLKLWEKIRVSIETLFEKRGGNGSGLLDWHFGCNFFLYQADHLAMPNMSASPSIIVIGLLEILADIAGELDRIEDGENWENKAKEMRGKLLPAMWNENEGVFYNHIDYQNVKHNALFYTDMVFPLLYMDLPEEYKMSSLDALCKRLMYKTDDDRLMMRVGELKPAIFGNDNVMPTQMCEAARGFFETGGNETGFDLIEAVALAGTIHTEAPGNFPERMDDDGKGEANYIFGNPIGSFIYSVISGLFGISLKDGGRTLKCSPAFPYDWNDANIQLPYCGIIYNKEIIGDARVKESYIISSTPARKLEFSIFLDYDRADDIKIKNPECEMKMAMEYGRKKVYFSFPEISGLFEIEISYTPARSQSKYEIKRQVTDTSISSSAQLLEKLDLGKIKPIDYDETVPFDLTDYYNSETITATSGWREENLYIDLSGYIKEDDLVEIEGIPFRVSNIRTCVIDCSRMILLEHSNSDFQTVKTIISEKPNKIRIDLDRKANAIALSRKANAIAILYASECQSRQTGVDVGKMILNYDIGDAEEIILNVGENIDTLFSHFATDTIPVMIPTPFQNHPIHPGTDYLNLLILPCDFSREITSIDFSIELPDVQFGLIGMSFFTQED